jgi:hypothetical protein
MKTSLITFLAITSCLGASAQQYTLDWHRTGVSGGQSTGGTYSLSGTLGQPFATALSGGNYALDSFWRIDPPFVPPPTAPELVVTLVQNTVVLSWPRTATGFILEQASALPCAANSWSPVPANSYQTKDANLQVVLPVTPGSKYYRLHQR